MKYLSRSLNNDDNHQNCKQQVELRVVKKSKF